MGTAVKRLFEEQGTFFHGNWIEKFILRYVSVSMETT
jgi:hypothetical protein